MSTFDVLKQSASGVGKDAKKKWAKLMGQEDAPEDDSLIASIKHEGDKVCDYFSLSYKQRMYGFGICFASGLIMGILGAGLIAGGHIAGFAVCYSIGTLLSIGSSCFIFGPVHQAKNMFKTTRVIATLVMLGFIVLTLLAALLWKSTLLCILFAIGQFFACLWYCLSYIPFARQLATSCLQKVVTI